jgi:TetR/AcrR family transcriptional repressor of the ameABC operon
MTLTEQHSATQKTILAAALKRVAKFGYTKTTMCEIASDVEMSPANIYRHFQSKQAILKSCAEHFIEERFSVLQLVVEDKNKTAKKKIKDSSLPRAKKGNN